MKYTFIHPTKSGGTAIENFFSKNYKQYIQGKGHDNVCSNENNPIIVVRDVKSRFLSMYKYWKFGSVDSHKHDKKWLNINKDVSVEQFIDMIKENDGKKMYTRIIKNHHFWQTKRWIGSTKYENIIIIIYEKDLNNKIQNLLNILDIPNKNIELQRGNQSPKISNEDNILDNEYVNNFINEYFKDDIKLINNVKNNPELFKLVL